MTRMRFEASSIAAVRAMWSIAALAMLYGAEFAAMWEVATDEIITMSARPLAFACARSDGRARRLRWCGPNACVATTRIISSGSVSATVRPRLATPALATRIPMGPNASSTIATAAVVNLLGGGARRPARLLGVERALASGRTHLHLYGKREVFGGRKMGHVTVVASEAGWALAEARAAAAVLRS